MPPNCVRLNDSLAIDKTEIANIHWLEYLYYLKVDSSDNDFKSAQLDSSAFPNYGSSPSKISNYLHSPEFRYYPVTGVTYEQAVSYCKWRSAIVNNRLNEKSEFPVQYNYRLPTEKEWEFSASGGLDLKTYPFGIEEYLIRPTLLEKSKKYYSQLKDTTSLTLKQFKIIYNDSKKRKQEAVFNVVHKFPLGIKYGTNRPISIHEKSNITESASTIRQLKFNKFGTTDMVGNVSEMVAEKGIAKGGSWAHDLQSSQINQRQYYKKPEAWLGFRCICDVITKK